MSWETRNSNSGVIARISTLVRNPTGLEGAETVIRRIREFAETFFIALFLFLFVQCAWIVGLVCWILYQLKLSDVFEIMSREVN